MWSWADGHISPRLPHHHPSHWANVRILTCVETGTQEALSKHQLLLGEMTFIRVGAMGCFV